MNCATYLLPESYVFLVQKRLTYLDQTFRRRSARRSYRAALDQPSFCMLYSTRDIREWPQDHRMFVTSSDAGIV